MGSSPRCDSEQAQLKKGPGAEEEDQWLVAYIKDHGVGSWRSLPKVAGLLRGRKSCRLRWTNHLSPDLKRGRFTEQEDELIIKLHALLGDKWSLIAKRLPGRTNNDIKNHWKTHIKHKLLAHGIDPQTPVAGPAAPSSHGQDINLSISQPSPLPTAEEAEVTLPNESDAETTPSDEESTGGSEVTLRTDIHEETTSSDEESTSYSKRRRIC